MNLASVLIVARKELKSYFLSPVALIFLGIFLAANLFVFFTYSRFFARNLADVGPLFEWLPVLLIFLVSALTMRQWSEEQKMGTLEVLMTLPVGTAELVLGKFLAGMVLVGLALGLTLPLPFSVWMLGPLDGGPVIGGYVAALLLAGAYMAIGLCVSARTDNQIVALMVSALVCSGIYLLGADTLTGLLGNDAAELFRALGSGSRFESIQRGVLDLRDLVYYATLTGFFLALNVYFVEGHRLEGGTDGRRARTLGLAVLLLGLNAVAANIWMAPVRVLRADLTARGEYSISEATERILAGLDEPLTITGYFSSRTHPLLSPLVPRIENLLEEYEVIGGGRVHTEIVDPNADVSVEQEIGELYGIKPVPFRVASRHEKSVVNSYFHLLVRYGDQHEVLGFDDLIEVYADETEVQVKLKNLEYDLTRAIKKATQGFRSIEALLARTEDEVKLTAYVTPDRLPEEFREAPERLAKVAAELKEKSGGRFHLEQVDPTGDEELQQQIYEDYGFRPLAVDLFGNERFYMHLLLRMDDRMMRVLPQGELTEANLRTTIESAIRRSSPGFLKKVGLVTATEAPDPRDPYARLRGGRGADFDDLEEALRQEYEVERLELEDGVVPGDVDVLLVAKAGDLDDEQLFAIDQYLMRGGALVVLQGAYDVDQELKAKKADKELLELLGSYGVEVEEAFVADPMNAYFPVPIRQQVGMFAVEKVQMMPYPFFPDVRRDGFDEGHPTLAGVPSLALTWSSPVKPKPEEAEGDEDVTATVLLRSSPGSWLHRSTELQPDFDTYPDTGFMGAADTGRRPLGVVLSGTFESHFAERPSPLFTAEDAEGEGESGEDGADSEEASGATTGTAEEPAPDRTGRTLKYSTPDARLAVIGSSSFASDMVTRLGFRAGTDSYAGNLILVKNLIDWALEDTELLEIRSAGSFARTLRPMTSAERTGYEVANYVVVLLALLVVGGVAITRRRLARPLTELVEAQGPPAAEEKGREE